MTFFPINYTQNSLFLKIRNFMAISRLEVYLEKVSGLRELSEKLTKINVAAVLAELSAF